MLQAGPSPRFRIRGDKNHKRGLHFFNTILDVCSNRGTKHKMGVQTLNGGPGTAGPHPLAMALARGFL